MLNRYIAIILLTLSSGAAQSKPGQELRIKGHVIGETVGAFLKAAPKLKDDLRECHATLSGPHVESAIQDAIRNVCGWRIDAFENNGDQTISDYLDNDEASHTEWSFAGGFLVGVSFRTSSGEYRAIRDDLTKRIGAKPIERPVGWQNGFGARWTNINAEWLTSKYRALLVKDSDPDGDQSSVTIQTRKSYESDRAKAKNKPSPLD